MIEAKFHGICPSGTNDAWGQFWIARYRNVGGTRAVQAYLCPPRRVVSAIVCLYLCESGLNSDVAVQMKPNAIRPSQRPRHIVVTGRKARARNRAIFSELPDQADGPGLHERRRGTAVLRRRGATAQDRTRRHAPLRPRVPKPAQGFERLAPVPGLLGNRSHIAAPCLAPHLPNDDSLDRPPLHTAARSEQHRSRADVRPAQERHHDHGVRRKAAVPDDPRTENAPSSATQSKW